MVLKIDKSDDQITLTLSYSSDRKPLHVTITEDQLSSLLGLLRTAQCAKRLSVSLTLE